MNRPRLLPATAALLAASAVWMTVPCTAAAAAPQNTLVPGDPAAVGMDPAALAEIAPRMREFVENKQISGAVALVARRGRIVCLEAVGDADVENRRPMRPDTIFEIASMTKPITATAVMILQDEGKLSVDDPVSKYVPEFAHAALKDAPLARPITIRDLLTHTSGLGGEQRTEATLQETAAMLAKRPLSFQPGTRWQYSPGLNVCGRIVEVAGGKPYDEFMAERIFRPLGMADTTFDPTPRQRRRLAVLYQPTKDKTGIEPASHWLTEDAGKRAPNPSGGLYSTAADLARFYQMVLAGGELDGRRIVSPAAVRQMTTVQSGDVVTGFTPGNGWGLGWCIVRKPQGVTAALSPGSFGHGGAFGTQGWVDPKRRMIFVLLIQRTNFGNSDGSDLRAAFQDLAVSAVCE